MNDEYILEFKPKIKLLLRTLKEQHKLRYYLQCLTEDYRAYGDSFAFRYFEGLEKFFSYQMSIFGLTWEYAHDLLLTISEFWWRNQSHGIGEADELLDENTELYIKLKNKCYGKI